MKKRSRNDWRRLVRIFEVGGESRREFCQAHGVSMSTLDYWRRRTGMSESERLVEVEVEPDGGLALGGSTPMAITWPNGVRVDLPTAEASAVVLASLHHAFGGGEPCSR
jgi:hypothetical protein